MHKWILTLSHTVRTWLIGGGNLLLEPFLLRHLKAKFKSSFRCLYTSVFIPTDRNKGFARCLCTNWQKFRGESESSEQLGVVAPVSIAIISWYLLCFEAVLLNRCTTRWGNTVLIMFGHLIKYLITIPVHVEDCVYVSWLWWNQCTPWQDGRMSRASVSHFVRSETLNLVDMKPGRVKLMTLKLIVVTS